MTLPSWSESHDLLCIPLPGDFIASVFTVSNTKVSELLWGCKGGGISNRNQNSRGNVPVPCKYVRSGYFSYLLSSSLEAIIKNTICFTWWNWVSPEQKIFKRRTFIAGEKGFPALVFLLRFSFAQCFVFKCVFGLYFFPLTAWSLL